MRSASKSIPFVVPAQVVPAVEPITQLQLELFLSLRNRLRQLESQGAAEENFRRNVGWKAVVIRLAERLTLNGKAYRAKVLAATKPSCMVSLVVG